MNNNDKQIWVDIETHRKAKSFAAQEGISMRNLIKNLVEDKQ